MNTMRDEYLFRYAIKSEIELKIVLVLLSLLL